MADKTILELPEITDVSDFWILGSKWDKTEEDVYSGRYLLADYINEVAKKLQLERRLSINMELASPYDMFIGEAMTIYKVQGLNVSTLKINGVNVTLETNVNINIPAKSVVTFSVERQLTDPKAYLFIYARAKV